MVRYESVPRETFVAALKEALTTEQAMQIKEWRKEETWRGVAEECHVAYMEQWQIGWDPPALQDVGKLITEAAAARLGEDANAAAWNG